MSKLAVLLVCCLALAGAATARRHPPKHPRTVAELVIANKDKGFGILLAAVQAADPAILKALSDPKFQGMVFAPNDDAFIALLKKLNLTPEQLLSQKELVTAVLKYHVVGGKPLTAAQVPRKPTMLQTLLKGVNGKFTIRRGSAGAVRIVTSSGGHAQVIAPNLRAGRAIVHGINAVLVPKQ